MTARTLRLDVPARFAFIRTVFSHGWFDLPPFVWDPAMRTLRYTTLVRTMDHPARAVPFAMRCDPDSVTVIIESPGRPDEQQRASVTRDARRILQLDEDLGEFHALTGRVSRPDLRRVGACGGGRLLRGAGVFEDLVKMMCTTNCGWPLTRVMVSRLVEHLGERSEGGARAFPEPGTMADAPLRFYRNTVRAGYRAPFLRDLARRVASRDLDPSSWADPRRADSEVRAEILSIAGAGPYVADNLMKLIGRYGGLGIDAWCRRVFSRMHAKGRKVSDARIERFYAPFGSWRGLALWCDITSEWFETGAGEGEKPHAGEDRVMEAFSRLVG